MHKMGKNRARVFFFSLVFFAMQMDWDDGNRKIKKCDERDAHAHWSSYLGTRHEMATC